MWFHGKNFQNQITNNRLLSSSQKGNDLKFIDDQREKRVAKFLSPNRLYVKKLSAKEQREKN